MTTAIGPIKGVNGARIQLENPPVLEEVSSGMAGRFLVWILCCLLALIGGAVLLSWRFGMEISVEGEGRILPVERRWVKGEVGGVIRDMRVRQGERVRAGTELAVLEGEGWKAELHKSEMDMSINRSSQRQLEEEILREGELLALGVEQARSGLEGARLQMERLRAELRISAPGLLAKMGWERLPFEELLPVRQQMAEVRREETGLRMAEERLLALDSRREALYGLRQEYRKLEEEHRLLRERVQQTVIAAPIDGVIVSEHPERRIGDRLESGGILLEMAALDRWQAQLGVKEADIPRVRVGQDVRLYVQAFPHMEYRIFAGRVERVGALPAGDGSGYPVAVAIDDPQVSDGERVYSLRAGMSVEGRVVVDRGRIAALIWRYLLRNLGKVKPDAVHAADGGDAR